jgi:hypothetical protein
MATNNSVFGFGVGDSVADLSTDSKSSNGVTPEFLMTLRPNKKKSQEEGRPMFDEVETVILHVAGDPWNHVSKPVDEEVKNRFRLQYANWKANREAAMTISGTPLSEWPILNKAQVAELNALFIYNVEGLSNLPDISLSKSHSLRELRQKAIDWLATAKDGAVVAHLNEENELLKSQLAQMAASIAALQEAKQLEEEAKKAKMAKVRSARKPKVAEAVA